MSIKTNIRLMLVSLFAIFAMAVQAQTTISGNVKDGTGEGVIGATVVEKGNTKNATVTDFDGNFTLKLQGGKEITISYIGMKPKTVNVSGKSTVNVVLEDDNTTLNEVVVVGYGTMKKSDLTGSVSSIGTDKLVQRGTTSVIEALQGAVPGVNITQSSGRTGGSFNVEIRGKSSINSSTTPIYVIDGVICDDMDFLNPQDIERIDVLKDASSTAIYGSRATAGVVMVTTKSGTTVNKQASKPSISYDGYYGISKVTRMPDFMDGNEFYQWRFLNFLKYPNKQTSPDNGRAWYSMVEGTNTSDFNQAMLYDGASGEYILKNMRNNGQMYDWPSLVMRDGSQQNHYLSISGSSEKISYHFGVGYSGEKGIFTGDKEDKITFKGAVDAQINKVISAGFSINGARIENDYAVDDAVTNAFNMNPFCIPFDSEGNPTKNPGLNTTLGTDGNQFTSGENPLLWNDNVIRNRETWRLMGNFYIELKPFKGLSLKTTFSPNFSYYRDGTWTGTLSAKVDDEVSKKETSRGFGWTWDNIVNYNTTIAEDHQLGVMGLVSLQSFNSEKDNVTATNPLANTLWWNLGSITTPENLTFGNSYGENSMLSYALRANYTYKGRYMITGTVRWDGSSKFADGNKWGCFPSAAVAWRISEEPFMESAKDWLSNLKLRLSYGVTGNNKGVGNYATQQALSGSNYYPFDGKYIQAIHAGSVVDENLKWEKSHEYNAGLDFGFLNGRISGALDIYQKTSEDLLYSMPLPLESGGGSVNTNIGKVRNRGVEFTLTTINIQNKDWMWSTTFNIAANKNKVIEVNGNGDVKKETGGFFIGESMNSIWGYNWIGIVTDGNMVVPDNEIAKLHGFTPGETVKQSDYYYACYKLVEGNPIIEDVNGDGKIEPDEDKRLFSGTPSWTGGFTTNLSYKNWDFSMSLYTKQNYWVKSNFMASGLFKYGDRGTQKYNMDYYIPAGTLIDCDGFNEDGTYKNPVYQQTTHYGEYPFPSAAGSNGGTNSAYFREAAAYTKASYVKVKNITLGYSLPKGLLSKFGCQRLRVYCTVTNPLVFTHYKGYDPEWASASTNYDTPATITWQFGANIKF